MINIEKNNSWLNEKEHHYFEGQIKTFVIVLEIFKISIKLTCSIWIEKGELSNKMRLSLMEAGFKNRLLKDVTKVIGGKNFFHLTEN